MKNRLAIIVLGLLCLGLAIAIFTVRNNAVEQKRTDGESILGFSNKWVETSGKLEDQKQVNAVMEKDLDVRKKTLLDLTNEFTTVSSNLSETASTLAKTEASLKSSQEELAKRDAKIGELETQNQALDKQAVDLSASITNLTLEISDTQQKLAASEGDKAFLQKELKRMMAEKAELERQFNDLSGPAGPGFQAEAGTEHRSAARVDPPGSLRQFRAKGRTKTNAGSQCSARPSQGGSALPTT